MFMLPPVFSGKKQVFSYYFEVSKTSTTIIGTGVAVESGNV